FFERITGARLLGSSGQEEVQYEDNGDQTVAVQPEPDEELAETMEETEAEPEETYSDENAGNEEEQEGQLTVDVFQDDQNIVVQSTIAGVSPDDLDVSITNDMVTIRGERRQQYDIDPEDYFYQECYWGTFSRSIILPVEIDADRAEAKIKNGVLTIRIPKANAAVTRKLKVKAT
ncbi:MAG: Hsp20/alpha crystallin family protein, partial [Candidatus Binatia bacterium]|nr:Hsp20/alpha crystallin family protein [Candidatus Binatia bacterium]